MPSPVDVLADAPVRTRPACRSRGTVLAVFLALSLSVLLIPWPGPLPAPGARELRIHAQQYAYSPGVLRVRQGERVTLVLDPDDVTHGLYVDGYGVDIVAVPGRPGRATFVADRPGKFRLRCSKVCGSLHPFMLGEMVVTPNSPFWRAAGLAVLAAIATTAFLWARRRDSGGAAA